MEEPFHETLFNSPGNVQADIKGKPVLGNFFEVSLDLLCVANMSGCFLSVNKAWEKTLGYSQEQLAGQKYLSFVHPDDVENTKLALTILMEQKEINQYINRFRTNQGSYRYLEWRSRIVGDIAYVVARDITERIEEEKKVNKLLTEVETIFNVTQDALFLLEVVEDGYRYRKINEAYTKLTGIESVEGLSPQDLWGKNIGAQVEASYRRCAEGKQPIAFEETLTTPVGKRTWHTTLTPVLEEGKPIYIVGSRHDITDEIKTGEELRQNLFRNEILVKILQNEAETIQQYLDFALEQALKLTKSKYGYIFFYDEARREFTHNTWSSEVAKDCTIRHYTKVYQLDDTGIWGEAVRQGKPIVVNDFQAPNEQKKGYPPGHIDFTRFMTVPVMNRKSIVAVVGVADKATDYTHMDILQLTILMNNVWKEVIRKRSEALLSEEKEMLRLTLLSVSDGVIATDDMGRVQLMNGVAEKLTGWPLQDAWNQSLKQVFNTVDELTGEKCEDPVQKVLHSGEVSGMENHTILIPRGGEEKQIASSAAPIKQENGEIKGVVLVFRDVAAQRQKQALIEHLSFHDQLTDLYNRRFFEEELKRLDTERNLPVAIVMADVNGLKLTNDAFGHATGDQLLIQAARAIKACCRKEDIIARLGGDEFVILLPKTGEKEAEALVQRITALCMSVKVDVVSLSISCGWAVKTTCHEEIYEVLKKSEDKMYRRKLFEGPSIRGQIIDTVVTALYEANRREKEHSERVSIICEKMGQALGCSEREIQELRTAGLMHDIGKVGIDVSVVDKPGPLTEFEWAEVRRHPEIGYRILSAVNDMSDIAQSVLAHHERWDGKGYPRGIPGSKIPLHARILAIADAYDAMTRERPYRMLVTKEEAENEILSCSGTQFDPRLVSIFLKEVAPALTQEPLTLSSN